MKCLKGEKKKDGITKMSRQTFKEANRTSGMEKYNCLKILNKLS